MAWLVASAVVVGIVAFVGFWVLFALVLDDEGLIFVRAATRERKSEQAQKLAARLGIPDPPKRYCTECASLLSWKYRAAVDYGFSSGTGKSRCRLSAEYSCPTHGSHYPAGSVAFWWTDRPYWGEM